MIQHRNLNGLRMFHHTARLLNFHHAADALNLTQGAVAQQVRNLEAELGVKLFFRQARGLSLTPQGAALAEKIGPALHQIDSALSAAMAVQNTLALSVTPSFASKWLGPRLPSFMENYPDLDLQITADQRVSNFEQDGIDMAVRQGGVPKQFEIDWYFLGPHNLVAVASRALVQSFPNETPLYEYPLIEDGHRPWATMIAQGSVPSGKRMLKVNQTALALDAAERGQGVALVPQCYLDPLNDDLIVLSDDIPEKEGTGFYLVWPKGRANTPAFEAVRNWLRKSFATTSKNDTASL
ncbi:LysR substrate-binding domain-containing protein [uncultured Sulfitobacter sp.]|uniref:LysR substrate-binding domain-containing protein n=1 Tax=uncultured Sulfitobacter sp. TaxID=191468 RepID=UPI002634D6E3|nr:LysR substrate-binding domain-containing protein [uncultured Sulfitobacter sp.]